MNFDKFTERSRGYIQSAQSAAARSNHQQLTPEHLFKILVDGKYLPASAKGIKSAS